MSQRDDEIFRKHSLRDRLHAVARHDQLPSGVQRFAQQWERDQLELIEKVMRGEVDPGIFAERAAAYENLMWGDGSGPPSTLARADQVADRIRYRKGSSAGGG